MIVKTLGYSVTGSEVCPFVDVAAQSGSDPFYPSKYVAVCALHGITTGKTATTFDPGSTITHQQLITMVARAAGLPDPPAGYTPPFTAAQFSLGRSLRKRPAGGARRSPGWPAGHGRRRTTSGARPPAASAPRYCTTCLG